MPITLHPGVRLAALLLIGAVLTFIAAQQALLPLRYDYEFKIGDSMTDAAGLFTIEPDDLIEEPGEINEHSRLFRFYERQDRLFDIMHGGSIQIGDTRLVGRPAKLTDLSPLFWVHVFVAFAGLLISGWVWSLKSRDGAAMLFAGSGIGLFISAIPAGIYTTRELALPALNFRILEELNAIGASIFGISMIGLFLIFPSKMKHWRSIFGGTTVALGIWTLLFTFKLTPEWANVNLIILTEMLLIMAVIAAQFFATRGNPVARASLTWLGMSVILGAGGFVFLNSVPVLLKQTPLNQGYAFLFFIIIYLGLAAGLTRYRLFDVGRWAFRLLYYAVGALLLILLDAALIYALNMERNSALGLSLLLVAFIYLPTRDLIWRKIARRTNIETDVLLADAMHVALAATPQERTQRWVSVLRKLFDPLQMVAANEVVAEVRIGAEGLTLYVPAVTGPDALKLSYPMGGRSLFDRASLNLARQLVKLVQQAEADRQAYDRGVLEERRRVAQDLHDDVGARLLTGLAHSDERMRPTLEAALADIRSIVGGMSGETVTWERLFADGRHECAQRLSSAGQNMEWKVSGTHDSRIVPETLRKLVSSALREGVSNIIRHAKARNVRVDIHLDESVLKITIEDDGQGLTPQSEGRAGFGLKSLERRVRAAQGELSVKSLSPGTRIEIRAPLS